MNKQQQAYLYQQPKTAMQSGRCKTRVWVLEFKLPENQFIEPIMHWTGSDDMQSQVKLTFDNLIQAEQYCTLNNIKMTVLPSHARVNLPKNYSDNFKYTAMIRT